MDTHSDVRVMSLPGERPGERPLRSDVPLVPPTSDDDAPARRGFASTYSRRTQLMAGGALAFVLCLGTASYFALQPKDGFVLTPPSAPAHSEVRFEPRENTPAAPAAPAGQAVSLASNPAAAASTEAREAAPRAASPATVGFAPAAAPASEVTPAGSPSSAAPAAPPTPAVAEPSADRGQPDPLAEHRRLLQQVAAPLATPPVPAPQSPAITNVMHMVTALTSMQRDQLQAHLEFKRKVEEIFGALANKYNDLAERHAMLEARVGFMLAQNTVAGTAGAPRPSPAVPAAPSAQAAPPPPPAARPARSPHGSLTYRITGASPTLAYLVVLNPAAGQAAVAEAVPGKDLPGYGRVQRIYQNGAAWEIQTEQGVVKNEDR